MKHIILIILTCFVFVMCSRDQYVFESPKNANYEKKKYPRGSIPVDPKDTNTIKKYSLVEEFTITDIIKEKGEYVILLKSDSVKAITNPLNNDVYSSNISHIVFSIKREGKKGTFKIKKGERYKMLLIPSFENTPEEIYTNREEVVDVYIEGKRFPVRTSTLNIYTSPNLNGLFYTPTGADMLSVPPVR